MKEVYNKKVFESMIRKYRLIIADRDEEIKAYKLQLVHIKEHIDDVLIYKEIDRESIEEIQELLEYYT